MERFSPRTCVVIGASGGIGSAFVDHLLARNGVEKVIGFSRSNTINRIDPRFQSGFLDYAQPDSIYPAAKMVREYDALDLVIVATGLLHDGDFGPEKSLRDLDANRLARAFQVNAIGPALVAKCFLPLLARDRKAVFAALSARVGSISDNRIGGWYGYRAAKAGLNQLLRTASIEHARRWPQSAVIGLHPGTVDTGLSKPFQRNVAEGKLFDAHYSTGAMLSVIDKVDASDTGKVFAYDGSEVPA